MNLIIYYSIIFILTLVSIIGLVNINKFENKLKLKGTKIVLFFIILMTYMTLVAYPVKKILDRFILDIKLPRGNKGPRGDRGKIGENAVCDTCGDDLCLKKILFNITNTYNYWRQLNGLKIYPDTYTIKNEYIKDKILKHCKSAEFQKIIKKFGSNNKTCPNNLNQYGSCGAYDYMFKLWSIWILIILKYKNGIFFLESDSLTDVDFDGLIEKEDCFLHNDIIIYKGEKYFIDKSNSSKRIHPMYHIIKKTNPSIRRIVHINLITLCTENTAENVLTDREKSLNFNLNRSWKNMFSDPDSEPNSEPDSSAGLKIKRIKRNINNKSKTEFIAEGLNDNFFKTDGLPHRGKLSPFDEIKKYDAWYWGRADNLKPEIVITKPFVSDFKKTCPNGKIKILETNKYFEIFTSKYKKYKRSDGNRITIEEILGTFNNNNSKDVSFLRASKIFDNNEHGYFKEYKPIGDILIYEDEKITDGTNLDNCLPDFPLNKYANDKMKNKFGYNNEIKKKITNKKTYLVSGDTKSPVDFELIWSYKKNYGINGGFKGLSIWRPIPPPGYIALGNVVDNRFSMDENDPPKPSFDSIACVPIDLLSNNTPPFDINNINSDNNWTEIRSDFFVKPNSGAQSYDVSSTKKFLRNNHTNTFASDNDINERQGELHKKINTESDIICNGSILPICNGASRGDCNDEKCVWKNNKCRIKQNIPKNNRSSIKDKKYSILKLYD